MGKQPVSYKKGIHRKGNILRSGLLLLVVFGAVLWVAGTSIDRIVRQMNESIVAELCRSHYKRLEFEFEKTRRVSEIAWEFIGSQNRFDADKLNDVAETMQKLDPKITRIWVVEKKENRMWNYTGRNEFACPREPSPLRLLICRETEAAGVYSQIINDTIQYFTLARVVQGGDEKRYVCGIDVSLAGLYSYLAAQDNRTRTYAGIFNRYGHVITFPDSLLLGREWEDAEERAVFERVTREGVVERGTILSRYLGVPVERMYFALPIIPDDPWVVAVSVPQMSVNDEMIEFRHYTLLLVLLAIGLFSVLLILSQQRLGREYELRRQAERESDRLQLQQVINQINPHFLFNSLNSLYALINRKPQLAREFVLKLSGVYRYVLEKEHDTLSSVCSEVEFTMQYYFLQKIRFEEQLNLSVRISPELESYRMPALSLQTVVENAIKHNQITPQTPLFIRVYTSGNRLVIENNYMPRSDSDSESMGVGLERIRTIYRFYTDLNMDVSQEGTVFRCVLPLLPPEK